MPSLPGRPWPGFDVTFDTRLIRDRWLMADKIKRDREADQAKGQERRRQLAEADRMQPIHWQAEKEVDGEPALSPVFSQTADAKGGVGVPLARRKAPLEAMLARGTINAAQYEAGKQFESLFARAQFESLQACDLMRPSGGRWREKSDAVLDARDQVWAVLQKLGGLDWIITEAAWQVIGQGRTIKEFCASVRLAKDAPLNPHRATGLVEGALTVMAGHFGTARKAPGARSFRSGAEWSLPEQVDEA